ncbi:MAG: sensor histidine kinase [Bacteroidota bacterium]
MLRIGLLSFLLATSCTLSANNGFQETLKENYIRLYESVDAMQPLYAISLADSLLSLLEERGELDSEMSMWIRYEKGEAFELLRDRTEDALLLYYEVVRDAEAAKKWEIAAEAYISIARTHEAVGRGEDTKRNLEAARQIIIKHDLPEVYSRYAVRNSSYHRLYANRDTAKYYALQAIEYGRIYRVERSELDGHLLMGILSEDLGETVSHFQEAVRVCLKRNNFSGATSQKSNVVSTFFSEGLYQEAMVHLDTAYMYAHQIEETYNGYYHSFHRLHDFKRQIFERQGLLDSAYRYLLLSRDFERKLNVEVNQQEISEKETAFAVEQEREKLRHQQQQSFYLQTGLVAFGIMLLGLLWMLNKNERKKRYIALQNDLIAAKNKALSDALHHQSLLLSEVHHRVKNNLQLVVSLLTLQGLKVPETDAQIQFEELSNKVHSIALIHEQLYKEGEFEKINLQDYFEQLSSHFRALQESVHPFALHLNLKEVFLNLETVLPLGIIAAELISNSLKYARIPDKPLVIQLAIKEVGDHYEFSYKDNGPGYPNEELVPKPQSMGTILINSMARQLKGKRTISNEDGASFKLSFQEKVVSRV